MSTPVLSVDRLVKRFGSRTAVNDVSFQIHRGEAVGLLGPNGAGKTTVLSLLVGLLNPDGGSISIHGRPIGGDTDSVKRHLGLATQDLALYEDLTALDNLAFFGALYGLHGSPLDAVRTDILRFVGLADRAEEPVRGFSGGMKRRLNLAVALLHGPDVLLLDEPTVGVDPQSRNALLENIGELRRQGKTIVYTTHYMEEVERLCERVIIIDGGRVLADARVADLKAQANTGVGLELGVALADRERGCQIIQALPEVQATEITPLGLHVLVGHVSQISVILEHLRGAGIPITALATRQPSLEDVFLKLTGRTLRD